MVRSPHGVQTAPLKAHRRLDHAVFGHLIVSRQSTTSTLHRRLSYNTFDDPPPPPTTNGSAFNKPRLTTSASDLHQIRNRTERHISFPVVETNYETHFKKCVVRKPFLDEDFNSNNNNTDNNNNNNSYNNAELESPLRRLFALEDATPPEVEPELVATAKSRTSDCQQLAVTSRDGWASSGGGGGWEAVHGKAPACVEVLRRTPAYYRANSIGSNGTNGSNGSRRDSCEDLDTNGSGRSSLTPTLSRGSSSEGHNGNERGHGDVTEAECNEQRVLSLVDDLLYDIYEKEGRRRSSCSAHESDYMSTSACVSSTWHLTDYEARHVTCQGTQRARLVVKDVEELREMATALHQHVHHAGARLVRNLRRREGLAHKRDKKCDVITAYLQANSEKRSEDTRIRFSAMPHAGDSGFTQWHDAMKMVARLPGGIPPEFRKRLWLTLAEKHLEKRKVDWKTAERCCLNEWTNPDDEELGVQIVKDLHRTGCSLFCGVAAQQNQALLKRVLLAFARWNKAVGYCQGFNMLAAIILQVMDRSDSDALKVMIYLIEGVLPESYFANNLRGLSVDMAVFRDLLRLRLPTLSRHLEQLQQDAGDSVAGTSYEPPLTNVFTMQWFLTLFSNCLPQGTVLRVWDLIFLEGNGVLLRTALAIWDTLQDRIMAVNSADEFYSIMGVLTREMLEFGLMDTNNLVKAVVRLSLPELGDLRDKYLFNITPWSHTVTNAARRGLRLFHSDDDDDDTDDEAKMAVAATYGLFRSARRRDSTQSSSPLAFPPDRAVSLDISALKQQYSKIRQRQRQAHIILSAACARQPLGAAAAGQVAMNHLLLGKSALMGARGRRGAPPGAVPPPPALRGAVGRGRREVRLQPPNKQGHLVTSKTQVTCPQPSTGETLHWKDEALRKSKRSSSLASETGVEDARQASTSASTSVDKFDENLVENADEKGDEKGDEKDDGDDGSSTSTELCDDEPDRMSDFDSEEPTSLSEASSCVIPTEVASCAVPTEALSYVPTENATDLLVDVPRDVETHLSNPASEAPSFTLDAPSVVVISPITEEEETGNVREAYVFGGTADETDNERLVDIDCSFGGGGLKSISDDSPSRTEANSDELNDSFDKFIAERRTSSSPDEMNCDETGNGGDVFEDAEKFVLDEDVKNVDIDEQGKGEGEIRAGMTERSDILKELVSQLSLDLGSGVANECRHIKNMAEIGGGDGVVLAGKGDAESPLNLYKNAVDAGKELRKTEDMSVSISKEISEAFSSREKRLSEHIETELYPRDFSVGDVSYSQQSDNEYSDGLAAKVTPDTEARYDINSSKQECDITYSRKQTPSTETRYDERSMKEEDENLCLVKQMPAMEARYDECSAKQQDENPHWTPPEIASLDTSPRHGGKANEDAASESFAADMDYVQRILREHEETSSSAEVHDIAYVQRILQEHDRSLSDLEVSDVDPTGVVNRGRRKSERALQLISENSEILSHIICKGRRASLLAEESPNEEAVKESSSSEGIGKGAVSGSTLEGKVGLRRYGGEVPSDVFSSCASGISVVEKASPCEGSVVVDSEFAQRESIMDGPIIRSGDLSKSDSGLFSGDNGGIQGTNVGSESLEKVCPREEKGNGSCKSYAKKSMSFDEPNCKPYSVTKRVADLFNFDYKAFSEQLDKTLNESGDVERLNHNTLNDSSALSAGDDTNNTVPTKMSSANKDHARTPRVSKQSRSMEDDYTWLSRSPFKSSLSGDCPNERSEEVEAGAVAKEPTFSFPSFRSDVDLKTPTSPFKPRPSDIFKIMESPVLPFKHVTYSSTFEELSPVTNAPTRANGPLNADNTKSTTSVDSESLPRDEDLTCRLDCSTSCSDNLPKSFSLFRSEFLSDSSSNASSVRPLDVSPESDTNVDNAAVESNTLHKSSNGSSPLDDGAKYDFKFPSLDRVDGSNPSLSPPASDALGKLSPSSSLNTKCFKDVLSPVQSPVSLKFDPHLLPAILKSPPRSPNRTFDPFPTSVNTRQKPKELAVKLGLYSTSKDKPEFKNT